MYCESNQSSVCGCLTGTTIQSKQNQYKLTLDQRHQTSTCVWEGQTLFCQLLSTIQEDVHVYLQTETASRISACSPWNF
eukprot:2442292-Amphidinium_carterae.1